MTPEATGGFPLPLDRYTGEDGLGLGAVLASRAAADPLNLAATLIFALAILHTFAAPSLMAASHRLRHRLKRIHPLRRLRWPRAASCCSASNA